MGQHGSGRAPHGAGPKQATAADAVSRADVVRMRSAVQDR